MERTDLQRTDLQRTGVEQHPVIVIGAGSAGLGCAAELRRRGVPAIVLDSADTIGASWRDRYDRLRLNSPRGLSTLPGAPYPAGTPVFPSRDEVVGYLRRYAAARELDVRLGVRVHRLDRSGAGWTVRTSAGDLAAAQVVVAGGYQREPYRPAWGPFAGTLLHAADYRCAEPFRGQDVLVVGPGSSGFEIAHDLAEGGAGRVRLAVRTPPNILLRSAAGARIAVLLSRLPPAGPDALMRFVRRRTIGDLSGFGLPIPAEGVFSRLKTAHVTPAIVDPAVIEAVRAGRIEIVAAVRSVQDAQVRLVDGTALTPDAVIAATGYRTGLEPLAGHLGVLDQHGVPAALQGEAQPGLRFIGYTPVVGVLGHGGRAARRAARRIARAVPSDHQV